MALGCKDGRSWALKARRDGVVRAKTLRMDEKRAVELRTVEGWGCASQDFKDG